jgi:hypothetical protein
MYYKNNVTEEVLGELHGVSQATISRAINRIEPVIADLLDGYVPDPQDVPDGLVVLVEAPSPPAGAGPTRLNCSPASTRGPGTTIRSERA